MIKEVLYFEFHNSPLYLGQLVLYLDRKDSANLLSNDIN